MTTTIGGAAMTLQAAALALACSGCSFLFVKGPPDHPASHRVVDCTTSRTAPVIDVIIGGLAAIGTVAAAAKTQDPTPGAPDKSAVLAVGALEAMVFLGSSVYGFATTAKCERAVGGQMNVEAPEPPDSPASNTPPHAGPSEVGHADLQAAAKNPPAGPAPKTFDPAEARAAISAALTDAISRCRTADGPRGQGEALVTYARDGHVASVVVTPPFADTATGGCIANALRAADVPPFDGEDVTVKKQFEVAGP